MSKKENNLINIIYHEENFVNFKENIIVDCQFLIKKTKGTLILTKNLNELEFLLNFLNKNMPNSKSVLIINGSSSEKTISFIKKNGYIKLFLKGCIYSNSVEKYKKVFETNKDFIESICTKSDEIFAFIVSNFDLITINQKFENNLLMNIYSYNLDYNHLHETISMFYESNQSIDNSKFNPDLIKEIDDNKKEIYFNIYNFYNKFKNTNNFEFISRFLKQDNLCFLFNQLLIKKEQIDFDNMGYFIGNFMHRIVEYGKQEKKAVLGGNQFYKGIQLNIFDLFEFIKNDQLLISFSHFMMVTSKKELAILNAQRNMNSAYRNNKKLFSVILNIQYFYDDSYKPSIFDLSGLMSYPDEEEYIVLPFTFFLLKRIKYDEKKMTADIDLEVIGKSEVLEEKVKKGQKLFYEEKNHIMNAK